jgi:hypothetical protein
VETRHGLVRFDSFGVVIAVVVVVASPDAVTRAEITRHGRDG